ncbi:hypothetical protein Q5752_003077 [Cryptotrichosporon argae]
MSLAGPSRLALNAVRPTCSTACRLPARHERLAAAGSRLVRPLSTSAPVPSGHSRWSKIRHKKGAVDAARGAFFSRLLGQIHLALRPPNSPEPSQNARLAAALARAKEAGVPKANVEAAFARAKSAADGTGQNVVYEAVGPGGKVAFMVECLTDNPSRTVQKVKELLHKNGARLSPVAFLFERKGVIHLSPASSFDDLFDRALTAGAEDVRDLSASDEPAWEVITAPHELGVVVAALTQGDAFELVSAEVTYVPLDALRVGGLGDNALSEDRAEGVWKIVDVLEDEPDVVKVWTNVDSQPPMQGSLVDALALHPSAPVGGLDVFESSALWTPCNARGVFGGQVVGQALLAASRTVERMVVHSQHCYFLLPATSREKIVYTVERLRDGMSSLVKAFQDGRAVFVLVASFSSPLEPATYPSPLPPSALPSPSAPPVLCSPSAPPASASPAAAIRSFAPPPTRFRPAFDLSPPDVVAWADCELEEAVWTRNLGRMRGAPDKARRAVEGYIRERKESSIAIAIAPLKRPAAHRRAVWLQLRLAPSERIEGDMVQAMFAYMTDFMFVGTAARALGLTWTSAPRIGMLASLDHTTHFPPLPTPFDPAQPLLHVMETVTASTAAGRGTVRGLLFTQRGALVCATLQEGVVRASWGKVAPKVERMESALGGVDVEKDEGDDKGDDKARAKL